MPKIKDGQFWESAKYNNYAFRLYYDRLVELSISMFKWNNLPETVDERFLELILFANGGAVFFEDEVMGHLALMYTSQGQLNIYREPINRMAIAQNGYQKHLTINDSVIIWNNMLRQNSVLMAQYYAKRLWDLDRIIDVNANAQKTPVLIQGDETEMNTLLNVYKKWQGNEPVMFGSKGLRKDAMTVLKTDAPYVADRIYQLKTEIWNEALTWLGISNINITKKERLITDEVQRNQGGTIASRYSRLNARQQACEKINKMFGLNVSCEFREDLDTSFSETPDENEVE